MIQSSPDFPNGKIKRKELCVKKVKIFDIGLVVMLFLAVLLAACGPAVPPSDTDEEQQPASTTEVAADVEEADPVTESDAVVNNSGETAIADLEYIETVAGTGPAPAIGDTVRVHYTGMLEDGTVFDSSEGGEPYTFPLGQGAVIPGWDQGIALMREGGQATLIIPPNLAYGPQGSGGVIPANATLTFEVELVEVIPAPKPQVVSEGDYQETEGGIRYYDIVVGDGASPEADSAVSIHFTGWLEDGTLLGGSHDGGSPISLKLGADQLFPGFEDSLLTMKVGGLRQAIVPPDLAFGETGSGVIPPNANIVLELELIDIIPVPEPSEFPDLAELSLETTESGLQYYDIAAGDGASPELGQEVSVHYTGWLTDGTKFDSSIDRGVPIEFILGVGGVIPGWDEGVSTMQVGGIRLLVIPAELGYGPAGSPPVIPPDAMLVFEVHLLEVR
jgi:peptidylprolyl isomerase